MKYLNTLLIASSILAVCNSATAAYEHNNSNCFRIDGTFKESIKYTDPFSGEVKIQESTRTIETRIDNGNYVYIFHDHYNNELKLNRIRIADGQEHLEVFGTDNSSKYKSYCTSEGLVEEFYTSSYPVPYTMTTRKLSPDTYQMIVQDGLGAKAFLIRKK